MGANYSDNQQQQQNVRVNEKDAFEKQRRDQRTQHLQQQATVNQLLEAVI